MPKVTKEYRRGFIPEIASVHHERKMVINAPKDFEGREEALSFIQNSYSSGSRIIVLWGIGGIGKTALARQFIVNSQYSCPQEVFFRDDENQQVTFSELLLKINYSADIIDKYLLYKTNHLEEQAEKVLIDFLKNLDDNTIILIDNINVLTNEIIAKLLDNTNCKILITARQFTNIRMKNAVDYEVKQLNEEIAGRIFQKIYGKFENGEMELFKSAVYDDFLGNTNAIILVGKMLKTQGLNLRSYAENKLKFLNDNIFTGEIHEKERPYDTIARNLCEFFNITQVLKNCNEAEMDILSVMMLIEQLGIQEQYLCNALNLKNRNVLITLEGKGLIRCEVNENGTSTITMHPMIALTLELYGVDSKNPRIKKIVFDYLNTGTHSGDFGKDRKTLAAYQKVVTKFQNEGDKVKNAESKNNESDAESYEDIPQNSEDLLDILLDKDNKKPIVLRDKNGREMCFEQVAVVPYNNALYCILKPLDAIEGIRDDEAIVFICDTDENGNTVVKIVLDEEVAIAVFEQYYVLLVEANMPDGE